MVKWILNILKFACPVLLLSLPAVVLFGALFPWSAGNAALVGRDYSKAVLVGVSYSSMTVGDVREERRSQTYALIPGALGTITVTERNGIVSTEENPFGLVFLLISYFLVGFGTWWFWIRTRGGAHEIV